MEKEKIILEMCKILRVNRSYLLQTLRRFKKEVEKMDAEIRSFKNH